MGKQSKRKLIVYLPVVLVATFVVVVVPMLLVLWLRKSGVVTSVAVGTVIGVVVSFLAAYAGGAWWKARTHSGDILFSELMLWGWVQRWRSERRLNAAADLLGLTTGRPQAVSGGGLTKEQKARLLTQLTSGLEARDPYTHGHSRRVARHASNIAMRMGLSRKEVAKIRAAGAMHDVGKVDTPIAVLHKEGSLTEGEYAIVKRHPVDGAEMVSTLHDDELTAMVRHHHERLDGTGYPDRLAGEAIPIGARILAVADTFDAITSTRPYRQAHAHKEALDILVADAGTQLDPDAVRAFCSCYSGRRPLAYWTILVNARPRLAAWLGSGLGPAKAATVGNVMATAAAAAAVGGTALGPLVEAPVDPPRALADATAAPAQAKTRSRPKAPTPRTSGQRASDPARPPYPGNRPGQHRSQENASGQTEVGQTSDIGQVMNRGQGKGNGQGQGTGNGQGQGQGQGQGAGNGKGQGQGQEKGTGKGRGQGQDEGQGQDKGPGQDKGQGQDKDKDEHKDEHKEKNRDKGKVNGQVDGQGPAVSPPPGPAVSPAPGPAVSPAPGSSPGEGNGNAPGGPSPEAGGPPGQLPFYRP